jgi:transcriptional regulator with XRE-family HTH domain
MDHEGKKLSELRESHGLKQEQVATEAQISPSRLCLIERWVKPGAEESQRVREAIARLTQNG